jgi:threonine/homoserine/homoserine lactone efflux protein
VLLWGIFVTSFIVGFSGAMMPGPMLGVTIDGSIKKGFFAGPLVVIGHAVLELLLVVVMVLGLKDFFTNPIVSGLIGFIGGGFLGWMGIDMVRSAVKKTVSIENQSTSNTAGKNLSLKGALVSATNPYFILWWATTGIGFIRQSYAVGLLGILLFFVGHILSDFTWYSVVSLAFSKGRKVLSDRVYRWIIIFLGTFLSAFSVYFIISGWNMLFGR